MSATGSDPLVRMAELRNPTDRALGNYAAVRFKAMAPVRLPRPRVIDRETYIQRLAKHDPMAVAIFGPVVDGMFAMAREARSA